MLLAKQSNLKDLALEIATFRTQHLPPLFLDEIQAQLLLLEHKPKFQTVAKVYANTHKKQYATGSKNNCKIRAIFLLCSITLSLCILNM